MTDFLAGQPTQLTLAEIQKVIESIERDLPPNGRSVLNCRAALERLEYDAELFQDLLGFFFSDTPKYMADLRSAVESRNSDLLRRAAHSLKGLISNFDAQDAAETAFRLETMGRNDALDDAPAAYDQIVRQLAEVRGLLQRFGQQHDGRMA
jgi:HPt (histidine-containing phosphotransfer) domain-containing protein